MKIKEISKYYGEKKVVNEVSMQIPRGKVTSLIGPNGAGKSTVLNIVTRLIAQEEGEVHFGDKELKEWKSKELAKHLAILTQANNISMKLKVKELVAFGRFPYSGSRLTDEDKKIVDEAITYMELDEFRERFIDQLSGGQLQRAYIAMVIAQDTDFIFLDEPTNNLDIYHASNMMKLAKKLCEELGKTVILVLHEINFAAAYSDYIGAFKDGKLFTFGPVNDVMTKHNLKELYGVDFDIQMIKGKPISIYY